MLPQHRYMYFVRVLCTSSSTATVASLSLPLSMRVSLFKGTSHNNIAISLPALLFFRSYNEVFVQTAFIPYYISTDRYTSNVYCVPVVLLLLLSLFISLSLCVCLCSRVPYTTISQFLYLPFYFFGATTKCLYKRHLSHTSLLARIIFWFVTTGLILCMPLYATKQHFSPSLRDAQKV